MRKENFQKTNIIWFLQKRSALKRLLVAMSFLLTFNYEPMAQENTKYGTDALKVTTGGYNAAFGYQALYNNTTGVDNTANGYQALYNNTMGSSNTTNGYQALYGNIDGNANTANGSWALYKNTNGNENTANGGYALSSNTTGSDNTANGFEALYLNTMGNKNTASGGYALYSNTEGNWNTANGFEALYKNTTGSWNTANGREALYKNTTGTGNTANGGYALNKNIRGDNNTANGFSALYSNTEGKENTANGYQALFSNIMGDYNVANGGNALSRNTMGKENTASGYQALVSNTTGNQNTALGFAANVVSDNLNYATAIGAYAKVKTSNTIQLGNDSVTTVYAGVGNNATLVAGSLKITGGTPAAGKVLTAADASGAATWQTPMGGGGGTGWGITGTAGTVDGTNFIGTTDNVPFNIRVNNQKAGKVDPNSFNTFYGYQSGNLTTGSRNTATGFYALYNNTVGRNNTAIGKDALSSNTIGNNNTAIGSGADVDWGNLTNATAIGANAIVSTSDKVRLGDANVKVIEGQVAYTFPSDARFKNSISETDVKGLEFIKKLRPVVYNFDTKKFQAFLTQNMPADVRKEYMNKDFSASTAIRQSGFIAQEVEKAAQEIGYDFNGIHKPENANDNYSLAYSQFVVPLVKGMQEQQKQIEDQQKVNQQLQQQINELKKLIVRNSSLTKDVATKEVGTANAEDISLYPNPTTGIFTITASHIDNGVIEIYDMAGNSMQKTTFNNAKAGYQLNVSGYAKGVYLLNIIANNKKYTKKLVIQ